MTRRDLMIFIPVAVGLALLVTYGLVRAPNYTDAYYYLNAANRLVGGQGMTDAYLWMYIGAPETLPAPSHLYWMPMASWVAAVGMGVLNAPMQFWAAQFPFALLLALVSFAAFWLTFWLGGGRRSAWAAGLVVLFGGFFGRFWGMTETFTPFAAFGVGCLIALGRGLTSQRALWFLLAGLLAGGAHLTRADGILLVVAGAVALGWLWDNPLSWRARVGFFGVMLVGYLLAMSPWFWRNWQLMGTLLPTGGAQGIWYTEYNDIFNYPPNASATTFFEAGGWALFWQSRWTGLSNGLGTLIVVEGVVVLFPLMLWALARRIREPFLRPFWVYALGLHLAMTVIFPFPGYRGGLFHSAAALFPYWAALGLLGLDDAIGWAVRRRRWNPNTAKPFFTVAVVALVVAMTLLVGTSTGGDLGAEYAPLDALLPADALVMSANPAELYYHIGRGGVVMPNEPPEVILAIAQRYNIDYLLVQSAPSIDGSTSGWVLTTPLQDLVDAPPPFLTEIPLVGRTDMRLYRIEYAS